MAGLFFYLLAWLFWIYLTFILDRKSPLRRRMAVGVLAVIGLAPYHVQVFSITVYLGALFLFFFSLSFLRGEKIKQLAYFYICSLILAIAYGGIQIFYFFDPVIFFINKDLLSAFIIGVLSIILQNLLGKRFLLVLFATLQGELLLSIVLIQLGFPYEAGGYVFLDHAAFCSVLILLWSAIEKLTSLVGTLFNSVERGKKLPHE
ncbi:hypothetical protein A8F94_03490 [Bacillus sp. FJAT-27225]|uniref:YphA family membrane protein n=1 Tax=Bacillus sp. FJAT-27225 TaxID=1743144 RepID=UPI00080C2938|nr:hypothetical protein [Bacillus sp. FJAT-27225]OCA90945.1 hypothetical protein A8F94_03490 [Bacillus sp. FJAT-27225]